MENRLLCALSGQVCASVWGAHSCVCVCVRGRWAAAAKDDCYCEHQSPASESEPEEKRHRIRISLFHKATAIWRDESAKRRWEIKSSESKKFPNWWHPVSRFVLARSEKTLSPPQSASNYLSLMTPAEHRSRAICLLLFPLFPHNSLIL